VGVLAVMHLKGENNLAQEESKEGGQQLALTNKFTY
jgi:hypothetical protein